MKTTRFLGLCAAMLTLGVATSVTLWAAESTRLKIKQTVEARFPPGLLLVPITSGEVFVMITVDETGRLTDALPTRYTHESLATEAMRILPFWSYQPATVDGQPVPIRTELQLSFEASGTVVSMDGNATLKSLMSFANRPRYVRRVCAPGELDRLPTPVRTVSPVSTANTSGSSGNQTAIIDFIIDEKGTPRMPMLVSSPAPELGDRAASALTQWQFSPPTRRGR
ncbi:MAG: energy transducer TonB, partial [Opitutus sp.]